MNLLVHFDFPQDDRESVEEQVAELPRIGENVGITSSGERGHQRLDTVLDVRHYLGGEGPVVHILLGS